MAFTNMNFHLSEIQRSKDYSQLKVRLDSFYTSDWINRKQRTPYPYELAKHGFYSMNQGDCVKCYSCSIIIKQWECDDEVAVEHFRHSPICKLAQEKLQDPFYLAKMFHYLIKQNKSFSSRLDDCNTTDALSITSLKAQVDKLTEKVDALEWEMTFHQARKVASPVLECPKCSMGFPVNLPSMFLQHVEICS